MATQKKSNSNGSLASYRKAQSASPQYMYPYIDKTGKANIPAEQYSAAIDKIERSVTNSGRDALDVFYTLTNKKGNKYYVRQRIPVDTNLMENFLDFLVSAGVNIKKVDPEDVSGVVGTVYVVYPDSVNCFGQVVYSKPITINHSPNKVSSMQELLAEDDVEDMEPDENADEVEVDDLEEEDIEEYLEEEE